MRRFAITLLSLAALLLLFAWLRRGSERELDALEPVADETERRTHAESVSPTERESVPVDPLESAEHAPADEPIATITLNTQQGYEPLETPDFAELEVLVLIDDLPASHVRVEVIPIVSPGRFIWPGAEPTESATRICATASDGIARFPELAPGSRTVRVTSPSGTIVTRVSDDLGSGTSRRVVFAFGSASVFGTVYGDDGVPAAGANVLILCEAREGAANWRAEIRTDERGSYSVDGLAPGFLQLVSILGQPTRSSAGHRARIRLETGEQRRVDLGSPHPLARWSGTLRLPNGHALTQPMRLWVFESDRGWRIEFVCDANGAFEFELPRGAYQILCYGRPDPIELGSLEVSSAVMESNITLPSPVVVGTVRWSDDRSPVSGRQLIFESLDGTEKIVAGIQVGAFCAYALPPRTYRVSVYNSKLLGHPPDGFELHVAPLATIELDLELLR